MTFNLETGYCHGRVRESREVRIKGGIWDRDLVTVVVRVNMQSSPRVGDGMS